MTTPKAVPNICLPSRSLILSWIGATMKSALLLLFGLTLAVCSPAIAQPAPSHPTEMISNYRLQHSEGKVTSDPFLNRIAQQQAQAMATKDILDHSVLGPFNSR